MAHFVSSAFPMPLFLRLFLYFLLPYIKAAVGFINGNKVSLLNEKAIKCLREKAYDNV